MNVFNFALCFECLIVEGKDQAPAEAECVEHGPDIQLEDSIDIHDS